MRYSAFISYNHKDVRWAKWLHATLEAYRPPKHLIGREAPFGPIEKRLPKLFRDRDELATSGDLAEAVRKALNDAATLIVICSPNGAKSRWVNEEIRAFTALGRRANVLCLIVGGEPMAKNPDEECLPPALFEGGASEPLAADLRPGQDGKRAARLKLLAGMLGVGYDELRQREQARRQRQLTLIAAAAMVGLLITSGLAVFALLSRAEAIRQRDFATQKTITAERTVSFVKSLFEVSDPSEARGATITAREILDRGARQIDGGLTEEPSIRAELATTLGEVYAGLGLLQESDRLIRRALGYRHDDPSTRARQLTAMGESQARQGEYAPAIRSFSQALAIARDPDEGRPDLVPRILIGLGEARSSTDDFDGAEAAISEALRIDLARLGPNHPDIARDMEARGLNLTFAERLPEARAQFERALAIRLKAQGPTHPRVSEDLNALGSIAYFQRDSLGAEGFYKRVLKADMLVLGPDHPDLATTLNNIARVQLERRAYKAAVPNLEKAIAVTVKEKGASHDDLAFFLANLGMVRNAMGDEAEAERLLRQALGVAERHAHRNLAPVQVELAAVLCSARRTEEARPLLALARPVMTKTYPDDPWRLAWIDNVLGDCLTAGGRRAEGTELLRGSRKILVDRWPKETHYGWLARDRLRRAGLAG